MIHSLQCQRCGSRIEVSDLNHAGVEMLRRCGPPFCLKGCRVRMVEVFEPRGVASA